MLASLVISTSNHVPTDVIQTMLGYYRLQTIKLDIIVGNYGFRTDYTSCDCLVQTNGGDDFSLARARNNGARRSRADWLIFTDIDTAYPPHLFEEMVSIDAPVVAGITRTDCRTHHDFGNDGGRFYRCANSPIAIKNDFFREVGGYSEEYVGWGYEDSDFEHKVRDYGATYYLFDSRAYHFDDFHSMIRNDKWQRSDIKNQQLFLSRKELPVEERIAQDRVSYLA